MSRSNFIPDPSKQFSDLERDKSAGGKKKYKFGDVANKLDDIKNRHPVFAFDFISLNKTDICFNSTRISPKKDYLKLIEGLKKVSTWTYDSLSKNNSFHFHEVRFEDTAISQRDFIKCFNQNTSINLDQCPTVYQFEIFSEARIFGFIHDSIFYLVLFDRNHTVYPRK